MRRLYLFLVFVACLFYGRSICAEESHPVTDIIVLRTGEQLQSPHVFTYRVAEWEQMRGRWIFPDIGYYDTGYGNDQIWFAGAGADIIHSKRIDWEQELYFSQEAGPESTNKRSLWVWPVVDVRFRPRLTGQFVPYPTIPLDRAQKAAFSIDRAKVEWAATYHWQVGAGYAGCSGSSGAWESSPFLSASRSMRIGKIEVWLQRTTSGAQVQLRYLLVREER